MLFNSSTTPVCSRICASITCPRLWTRAVFFSIFHSRSPVAKEIVWYCFLQSSCFRSSSLPSSCKVCSSPSIALITSSKWPTSLSFVVSPAAKVAKRMLRLFPALACKVSRARAKAEGSPWLCMGAEASCKSVAKPGLMAFEKSSLALSAVRICKAWVIPASSSLRSPFRIDHSSDFATQEAFVASKKATSAFSWAMVSEWPCVASANIVSASAFSCCFFAKDSCKRTNCECKEAMRSSYARCAPASSFIRLSRSVVKVSYMSCKMPWIVADCGLYRLEALSKAESCCLIPGFPSKERLPKAERTSSKTEGHVRPDVAAPCCRNETAEVASFSILVALSNAAEACWSSPSSAKKASCCFCLMLVAVFCEFSFSRTCWFRPWISVSRVVTWPLRPSTLSPSERSANCAAVMDAAFFWVVVSHQQANLSNTAPSSFESVSILALSSPRSCTALDTADGNSCTVAAAAPATARRDSTVASFIGAPPAPKP
mmetsp:Transcript_134916/g.288648  ORF Transcript_134916/g.288648 Transcript_134916/m.288648 type:complete len:487 (+) Transcript_134916:892-2352(+)